jgi:hypothetical protein
MSKLLAAAKLREETKNLSRSQLEDYLIQKVQELEGGIEQLQADNELAGKGGLTLLNKIAQLENQIKELTEEKEE